MKYRDMTSEEKEAYKARQRKYNAKHKEEIKKYRAEHKEERNAWHKKYNAKDLNKNGVKKVKIRRASRRILDKVHAKLPGYEIHHCFGYEYPDRFIYIPKPFHDKIHAFLDEHNLTAAENHWNAIRDMVNSYDWYTYIRC